MSRGIGQSTQERVAARRAPVLVAMVAAMSLIVGAANYGFCDPKPNPGQTFAPAEAAPMPLSGDPHLPHWFLLVNGEGIPSPMAPFTPSVLTVNGSGPAGSPNPNGGTGVGVAPMNLISNPASQPSPTADPAPVPNGFTFTGAQLWKALPGAVPGYFLLRSAESFTTTTDNNPLGSLMLGYGVSEAPLELGWLSGYDGAIYWDQSVSPTGDNSCFQQWSYDFKHNKGDKAAQLTDCNGGQLYNSTPTVKVGTGTSAPGNQWYPLPNYQFEGIVNEKNCDEIKNSKSQCDQNSGDANATFPVWTGNQANAYNWVSEQYIGKSTPETCQRKVGLGPAVSGKPINQQTLEFTGVRCEYSNENFIRTAASAEQKIHEMQYPQNPSPYFSQDDLSAVQQQLSDEINDMAEVASLLNTVHTVMQTVFWENSNTIPAVINDLALSKSDASTHAVAAEIVEGSLYTALSALGPVTSVAANVMQTAIDTAAAAQPTFEQDVGGTVSTLYSNLNTQFNYISDALTADYITIVYDWGRMSVIGPMTQQQGYWGLFWPANLTNEIVPYLVNGYQITVMKSLLPLVYNLHELAGQTESFFGPPSWAQYMWDFGSGATTTVPDTQGTHNTDWSGYNNQGYWEAGPTASSSYPSSTVMQNDLLDLGANPFEIFSGIDGWGSGGTVYCPNLDCNDSIMTLFNTTPKELWVEWTSEEGVLSAPNGTEPFNYPQAGDGLTGTAWTELRPYGYTTMFFAPSNSLFNEGPQDNVNVWLFTFSNTNSVGSFDWEQDGCSSASISAGPYTAGGYEWGVFRPLAPVSPNFLGGVFAKIANSSIPAK